MFSTANFPKIPVFAFRIFFFGFFYLSRNLGNECVGVLIRTEKLFKKEMTAVWEWKPNTEKRNTHTRRNEDDLDLIPYSYFHFSVEFSITLLFFAVALTFQRIHQF